MDIDTINEHIKQAVESPLPTQMSLPIAEF